jgi:hypothetical protein
MMWRVVRELQLTRQNRLWLSWFLTAWLFLWTQNNNLTWGFQSQFILAQSIPFWALFLLYRAYQSESPRCLIGACVFGVFSLGTMANGILALPIMTLYAFWVKRFSRSTGLLLGLSLFGSGVYLFDYVPPEQIHSTLWGSLIHEPIRLLTFVLMYFGNIFGLLVGKGEFGRVVCFVFGVLFMGALVRYIKNHMGSLAGGEAAQNNSRSLLAGALIAYILYIFGTATVTAGGRLFFGLGMAMTSRYTTPALMAWSALMLLWAPVLLGEGVRGHSRVGKWVGRVLLALILLYQPTAMLADDTDRFKRELATLAIMLEVPDEIMIERLGVTYTKAHDVEKLFHEPSGSVFATPRYAPLRAEQDAPMTTVPACAETVHLNQSAELSAIPRSPWTFHSGSLGTPPRGIVLLEFRDEGGSSVGWGLVRHDRSIKAWLTSKDDYSWSAYLKAGLSAREVLLYREGLPVCYQRLAKSSSISYDNGLISLSKSKT